MHLQNEIKQNKKIKEYAEAKALMCPSHCKAKKLYSKSSRHKKKKNI